MKRLDTEAAGRENPPVNDTAILHRIYLKQVEQCKGNGPCEIVPATFNYQDFIVVDTGHVEYNDRTVVFQTHSCGCGPQPTIWGGLLEVTVPWPDSELHAIMANSANPKNTACADTHLATEVYRIRRNESEEDRSLITAALKKHFGRDKKISFF